jgi:hypothetical protein
LLATASKLRLLRDCHDFLLTDLIEHALDGLQKRLTGFISAIATGSDIAHTASVTVEEYRLNRFTARLLENGLSTASQPFTFISRFNGFRPVIDYCSITVLTALVLRYSPMNFSFDEC